nr:HAMP domain-containing histidine kinase [candidate division Zixibacteria bacterium]
MIPFRKRTAAVIIFTALIIILVNVAWWLFYSTTGKRFEYQLSHRLESVARLGAAWISPELAESLKAGYLSAYDSTLGILGRIMAADSLSEVFIIDNEYHYMATTLLEADSIYYLAPLNDVYIDSVFTLNLLNPDRPGEATVVTDGYRVGDIVLKSAFTPIFDSTGLPIAVLGIEADVDYTGVLIDLRRNLYLSSLFSICGGLLFGFFFFLVQRRINAAERSLFMAQSQANLGRMVAVVSHEIKNPLMIIRASAERLKKSGLTEADFIIEETDRLNGIVSAYLDFASGKKILKNEKIEIGTLLDRIAEQFHPRLIQDGISLAVDKSSGPIAATADPAALRQVIINLVLNGAEAVRGISGAEVSLGYGLSGGRVVLSVKDNGRGMDQNQIKSIFEPFYTTGTTGSGLGLYLSRTLIEQMQGEITVVSCPGGPTIFRVVLPGADKDK